MSSSDSDKTLRIECPTCSKVIRAPKSMAGKKGKCPGCGNRIQIPGAKSQSETPSEASPPERPRASTAASPPAISIDTSAADQTVASSKVPANVSAGIQVLESRATPAVWLLRITMLVLALQIFIFWSIYESRQRRVDLLESEQAVFVLWLIMVVVTGVFFLRWKYRASANLHSASKRRLKYTPFGCCGYYFLPFLNFVFPMRAMHEIQSRSKANVGYMVYIWWILLMLSTLIERAVFFPIGSVIYGADWIGLIAVASGRIIAGFILIRIIKAVTEKQRRYRLAIEDFAT